MKTYDVIVVGAGAAGLWAAGVACNRNKKVLVLDMGAQPARKVAVSGGGHCNFTNASVARHKYFGENPNFVNGALSRIHPEDVLQWAKQNNIQWTEKTPGRYFCTGPATNVSKALTKNCQTADILSNTKVIDIDKQDLFYVKTNKSTYTSKSVIIASGGLSYPVLDVSDVGYRIAKKFGHKIVPVRPALCAITTKLFPNIFAGISLNVCITIGKEQIVDSMLITHFGLGGPAIYRTTVRNLDTDIHINLLPNINVYEWLKHEKQTNGKKKITNILSIKLPDRIAMWLIKEQPKNIADYKDADLQKLAQYISDITISKDSFKLYNMQSAEVVRGGVSTDDISSKTMESKLCPGLFFAGEALDITGDLGGFNLHWAFASGQVAGENA